MNNRISVATIDSPEFINLEPVDINPLMSKCDIKVLYVGQNRNRSCITKEVATQMSKTLRGCPIAGYYIENKEDFGDHGDQVIIDGEGVKFNKLTKPYGFVAPDAKVWFQFFEDTDEFGNTCIREYLMTTGFLWTGQFEECKRVLENNNPQSMELDEKSLRGYWSTDTNRGVDFFIINDAIFSELCILGDDVEPCFEGASVSEPILSSQFSKDDNFAKSLFTMMQELRFALSNNEGGKGMKKEFQKDSENQNTVTQFEEAGGDASTDAAVADASADNGEAQVVAEDPAAVSDVAAVEPEVSADPSVDIEGTPTVVDGVTLNDTDENVIADITKTEAEKPEGEKYAPEGETTAQAVVNDGATNVPSSVLENSFKKEEDDKDKDEKSNKEKTEENIEDEEKDEKEKKKFSLEDQLSELQNQFAALKAENEALSAFKQKVENEEKDALIASFCMLSDEDKKEVIENKEKYTLKEIKAELSMICVDKKVDFSLFNNTETAKETAAPVTFNLNSHQASNLPAWLKAVEDLQNKNN